MIGSRRLWCDETINEVLGIDDRFVAIRGHTRTFVYDHTSGELVPGRDPASVPAGTTPLHPRIGEATGRWAKASPDGRWAAVGRLGSRLRVFDNTTGEMKFPEDPSCAFDELAFSHDGASLVAMAGCAYVYPTEDSARPRRELPALTYRASFTPSGDLVGGAAGKLARWSLDGRERARVSVRHKLDSLSFSLDGRYASATSMITGGLCMSQLPDVVVADLVRGVAILRFRDESDVTRRVAISPDARWLALTDAAGVRLMPATPRAPWQLPPVAARWPDGELLLVAEDRALRIAGGMAHLIELPHGRELGPARAITGELLAGPRGFIEVAPDRHRLRFLAPDLTVTHELGETTWIEALACSPDGGRLAISDGPTIRIVPSGEP